jgi:bacillithiol system protein YtxJ
MRPDRHLADDAALARAVARPAFLLFKQSFRCPISCAAFERWRAFAAAHPGIETGWIDVVEQRPLARGIAERTGVPHESPQALWFRDGRVVWHASHDAITEESLAAATGAGPRSGTARVT